jgi:hypothetical protein
MDDSIFLVADIDLKYALNRPAEWVIATGEPFTRFDPIDLPDSLRSELFEVYMRTYKRLGMHLKEKEHLDEYNRWILIRNKENKPVAFLLLKTTAFGLKLGAAGSDGSREGKDCVLTFLAKILTIEGVYGEISPPLEGKLSDNVPKVAAGFAEEVLEKDIEPDTDKYHYLGHIKNIGQQRKLMVGKPTAQEF